MKEKTLHLSIKQLLQFSDENLEESSFHQLDSNTKVFFDTPREQNSRRVQISNLSFDAIPNDGKLKVTSKSRSKQQTYNTIMVFDKVRYVEDNSPYSVKIKSTDGSDYSIISIRGRVEDVKVSCTCLDFYYRFATWNHKDDSLNGDPPPPYVKKTNLPPVNPDKVPGVCKHIMKLAQTLKMQKILK